MTTSTIHADVIGSTYTNAQANILKLKAIRKFIVKSDVVTTAGVGFETIITEMKGETGSHPNLTTQLGPIYNNPGTTWDGEEESDPIGQVSGAPIVHPSNNDCFLQTVDVAVLGDQRYLVTAQYGVTQGFGGSGANPNTTCQFRGSTRSRRVYDVTDNEGSSFPLLDVGTLGVDTSPVKFSDMQTIPVLKVQVPFYLMSSPVGPATYQAIGGVNSEGVIFNDQNFSPGYVRFDGVQMDEYGGAAVGGNGVPYKYRGFYEFTVDSVAFAEQRPVIVGGSWVVKTVQANVTGNTWTYSSIWYT